MGASDFDLLAASLRADAADTRTFVEALAEKLQRALPSAVRVDRSGGFLGGRRHVRRIQADLGDQRFELEHDDGRVRCRRRTIVRGITLKNDELAVDAWIDELSRTLIEEAAASERGRQALERLLA